MKFVSLFRFTGQGVAHVKDTTKRAKNFAKQAKSFGVNVTEFLWTQGRYDGIIIFDAPDRETAAAALLSVAALGNVQTETLNAFDAKGMDKVLSKMK